MEAEEKGALIADADHELSRMLALGRIPVPMTKAAAAGGAGAASSASNAPRFQDATPGSARRRSMERG